MTTVEAIIERAADGTYTVYCKDEVFSGAGSSIEGAKTDMLRQMSFYRETAIQQGFRYPSFLDGDFEVKYQLDIPSLMKYYVQNGIFSLSCMEKVTGINQKQLWSYLNGTKPRRAQCERIERGFRALEQDLHAIFA